MDPRIKQRLVGAIVLISLAVIFIPFILEGPDDEWTPRTQDMPQPPRIDYQAEVELPIPQAVPEPVEVPASAQHAQEAGEPANPEAPPTPSEPAVPEPPAAQAAASQPVSSKSVPAPAGTGGKWVIQVGSFSQQPNASGLRDRLHKAGYTSYLQKIDVNGTAAWRVLVGPYDSREQAERQRDRISREQQLKGLVTQDQG